MPKSPAELYRHILKEIAFVQQNKTGLQLEAFLKDEVLQRAFVRSIEIIGEAVKNIPAEIKDKYPEISWKKIAGTRDRLIHNYFETDLEIVWEIIQTKLPDIKPVLLELLSQG